jgi:hypothetical protein
MRQSATDGASCLPAEDALAIWAAVDRRAAGGPHSRSLYYDEADSISDGDRRQALHSWVEIEYLSNLPEALGMGFSLPRAAVTRLKALDPLLDLPKDVADPLFVRGRDCVLLSSAFLGTLDNRKIERLRALDEFKDLSRARRDGDTIRMRAALFDYLRALGQEAPGILDPSIRSLEAQVRFKRALGAVSGIVVLLTRGSDPLLAGGLAALAIFLGMLSSTEKRRDAAVNKAARDIQVCSGESLAYFCHDSELKSRELQKVGAPVPITRRRSPREAALGRD